MEESREKEIDDRYMKIAEIVFQARMRQMKNDRQDHTERETEEPPKTSTK